MCLCCPLFFSYAHLDYREMGGAFFLSLGMYYLLRYLQEGVHQHLLVVAFAIIAGFLQRRPVGAMLLIAVVFIFFYCVTNKRWWADRKRIWMSILLWLTLCASIALALYPWLYITRDVRPYQFLTSNFSNFEYATAYIRILPHILSWPITILFCFGLLATLIKRSLNGLIAGGYLVVFYLLFTGDIPYCIPTYRFTILFVPFLAIITANFIGAFSIKWLQTALLSVAIVLSLFSQLIWHSDRNTYGFFPINTPRFSSLPYYPFDDVVKFLEQKEIKHGTILFPVVWQTSSAAYYRINDISGYRDFSPPIMGKNRNNSMSEMKRLCKKLQCTALIVGMKKDENDKVVIDHLTDLTFKEVKENKLDGFKVEETFFNRKHGLALPLPK